MSRTDKDAPWWVRAEVYEPDHDLSCVDYSSPYGWFWNRAIARTLHCDLPPTPMRRIQRAVKGWSTTRCSWTACWPNDHHRYRYTRPPTKEERHCNWWGPHRAELRELCTGARKQYHGDRDAEILAPPRHHRHNPVSGGYWD